MFPLTRIEPNEKGEPSIVFDYQAFTRLMARLRGHHGGDFLRYNIDPLVLKYGGDELKSRLIRRATQTQHVWAPYTIEHDYRALDTAASAPGWGSVRFSGDYCFPPELESHKSDMIQRFDRQNLLKRNGVKNSRIPRVAGFSGGNGSPEFVIERAYYFDQVGTNLSLDYRLEHGIDVPPDSEATCVRDWDQLQATGGLSDLPSFRQSRLANTIGVAVGVTATREDGTLVWVERRRRNNVAVYPGMWHVPLSFALAPQRLPDEGETTIESMIGTDFGYESAEELGLDASRMEPARPIAFCRDLIRGGKPQFFFLQHATEPYEKIVRRIREHPGDMEYVSRNGLRWRSVYAERSNYDNGISPELLAIILLHAEQLD